MNILLITVDLFSSLMSFNNIWVEYMRLNDPIVIARPDIDINKLHNP